MKKKQRKDLVRDAGAFVGLGVGLGVGASVVGAAGGSGAAIGKISGYMPVLGTAVMGGHLIKAVGDIDPYKNKKRKGGKKNDKI